MLLIKQAPSSTFVYSVVENFIVCGTWNLCDILAERETMKTTTTQNGKQRTKSFRNSFVIRLKFGNLVIHLDKLMTLTMRRIQFRSTFNSVSLALMNFEFWLSFLFTLYFPNVKLLVVNAAINRWKREVFGKSCVANVSCCTNCTRVCFCLWRLTDQ